MSKILITGAAGFIGSQLSHRLWQNGNEVVLVDDFSYGFEDNLIFDDKDFRGEIIRADICDRAIMHDLFEKTKFDYVYHIAAITPLPDCQTNPYRAVQVNVAGTVSMLEEARLSGVKNFIFASTSAVYENCTEFPTAEGDAVPPNLVYSSSKYTAEHFCRSYVETYGMNVTVLRFANVYGPHMDCLRVQPPVVGYIIRELYCGQPVVLHSTGNQRRDFIFVEDLISLALLVMDNTGFDCVNVSSGETVSINELYNEVADVMGMKGKEPQRANANHFWGNYPKLFEGGYSISEKVLTHEIEKHTECANTHAFKKFGWSPMYNLRSGINKTVEYTLALFEEKHIK